MKIACATLLALTVSAGSAMAATPLDGTFNGYYSCPSFQGPTNVLLSFFVTGTGVKLVEVIYHNVNSNYKFGSSVIEYQGTYGPNTRKFTLSNLQTIGEEPQSWSYSRTLSGAVSADGTRINISKDPSSNCSATVANRVGATTIIRE